MNRACAVCVVLFNPRGGFHANQNNSKVLLFEKGLGVDPFGPRFVMLKLGNFVCEIKVREISRHRAIRSYKWIRHTHAFLLKRVRSTTASLCSVSFAA